VNRVKNAVSASAVRLRAIARSRAGQVTKWVTSSRGRVHLGGFSPRLDAAQQERSARERAAYKVTPLEQLELAAAGSTEVLGREREVILIQTCPFRGEAEEFVELLRKDPFAAHAFTPIAVV
jgi:hypothetical protein